MVFNMLDANELVNLGVNQQAWRKGSLTCRIFWYQGSRLAKKHTLPETNSLPLKNQWLEDETSFTKIPYVSVAN